MVQFFKFLVKLLKGNDQGFFDLFDHQKIEKRHLNIKIMEKSRLEVEGSAELKTLEFFLFSLFISDN